jgi:hypothetical protein
MVKPAASYRRLLWGLAFATAFGGAGARAAAAEIVMLELVLAVDCSSSVSDQEFQLQIEGIAGAFEDEAVLAALQQAGPRGIAVSLLQWSSARSQAEAIGWTHLTGIAESLAFAARVRATPRMIRGGATAISSALNRAVASLHGNAFTGERLVIDVSGDGRANEGGSPAVARAAANRAGVTINGLAILNEEPELAGYYIAGVVGGPGAFLLSAGDYSDFALAMRQKLYAEILGQPVARLPGAAAAGRQVAYFPGRY